MTLLHSKLGRRPEQLATQGFAEVATQSNTKRNQQQQKSTAKQTEINSNRNQQQQKSSATEINSNRNQQQRKAIAAEINTNSEETATDINSNSNRHQQRNALPAPWAAPRSVSVSPRSVLMTPWRCPFFAVAVDFCCC
jgi:5-formyltetrahydrofolate cyclo-ligase